MNVTEDLIQKFFAGECDETESTSVAEYLNQHPELKDHYLPLQEWVDAIDDKNDLAHLNSDEMWDVIDKKTTPAKIFSIKRWAIAASIIGLLTTGYLVNRYYFNQAPYKTNLVQTDIKTKEQYQTINNISGKDSVINLPDGSIVTLAINSRLSYEINSKLNRRILKLDGDALFKVAKDKSKPFIVYSGDISTIDLGTEFYISHPKNSSNISVTLYEGKVAVKTNLHQITQIKTYYLQPGNRLIYNERSLIARIVNFKTGAQNVALNKTIVNWFMFNNDSLSVTLDQLEAIYNVQIKYSKQDLKNISFIGQIKRTDSIENILKDISSLNNLSLIKKGNVYTIQKK